MPNVVEPYPFADGLARLGALKKPMVEILNDAKVATMSYRDDLHAAHLQIEDLKHEIALKEQALANVTQERMLPTKASLFSTHNRFFGLGGTCADVALIGLEDEMEILYEVDRAFGGGDKGTPTRHGDILQVDYAGIVPTSITVNIEKKSLAAVRNTRRATAIAYAPATVTVAWFVGLVVHAAETGAVVAADVPFVIAMLLGVTVAAFGTTRLAVIPLRNHIERKLKRAVFDLSRKKSRKQLAA